MTTTRKPRSLTRKPDYVTDADGVRVAYGTVPRVSRRIRAYLVIALLTAIALYALIAQPVRIYRSTENGGVTIGQHHGIEIYGQPGFFTCADQC
jgi:hypothetical protein